MLDGGHNVLLLSADQRITKRVLAHHLQILDEIKLWH